MHPARRTLRGALWLSCLFLARGEPTQYGYSWPDRGADGPHSTPEGVAKAAKLLGGIFGDKGPWVMVEVFPLPDIDPEVDEADVALLAETVARYQPDDYRAERSDLHAR